jgi:hypothetical protein
MADQIDGPLMVHAINAAEGVLASGQEGPEPAVLLIAAQSATGEADHATVHVMSTATPELQLDMLEEAIRMVRERLASGAKQEVLPS